MAERVPSCLIANNFLLKSARAPRLGFHDYSTTKQSSRSSHRMGIGQAHERPRHQRDRRLFFVFFFIHETGCTLSHRAHHTTHST